MPRSKARHLTRSKVATDLGVSKGSICGWLVPHDAPPSAGNISKIRRWLSSAPKPMPETPAAPADWPALREQLRAVIRDRALTHAAVGAALDVQAATVGEWVAKSHEDRGPGPRALIRVRQWLLEGAMVPATYSADAPLYTLAPAERDRLAGYLSLEDAHGLRERFGATPSCSRGPSAARILIPGSSAGCAACCSATARRGDQSRNARRGACH